ncbi:unnamed protein product [Clonostachys byssicola]|uniref:Heterokaryon incompatibility domain-containing protein n=1 Tax=Clonostachys byssicola TaxID=160290 RepID=A0A9N9US12_9HYPO|nr:unnamed protein product [Clonostachys byssicola]
MLCSACIAALTTDIEERMCRDASLIQNLDKRVHHPSSKSFYKATEDKCYICLNLLHLWEHKFKLRLPFPSQLDGETLLESGDKISGALHFSHFYLSRGETSFHPVSWPESSLDESFAIIIYLEDSYKNAVQPWSIETILVSFVVNPYNHVQQLLPKRNLSGNTGHDASFWEVQEWLRACSDSHQACKAIYGSTGTRPTRIVNLSHAKDFGIVRVQDGDVSFCAPYATLSHCWGASPHTRLLKENRAAFCHGVLVSQLPRVYQEAIDIGLRLGVQYLWIDSLCIVQDDEADWLREASRMFDIYRNALINIGATGPSDGHGTCFIERDRNLLGPCLFNKQTGQHVDSEPEHPQTTWHVVEERFWIDRLHRQALNRRAWVLQERLISPRMVHFGADQIYWECHELHACEVYPKGPLAMHELQALKAVHTAVILQVFAARNPRREVHSIYPTIGSSQNELALFSWSDIIWQYGRLELTVPSDRLIALSGLARHMQDLVQDEYVAGLWRSAMITGLLWRVNHRERQRDGEETAARRLVGAHVPSWSWASMHGNIYTLLTPDANLKKGGLDVHIAIKDIALEHVGDRYGNLHSAVLKVECRLWPAAFLDERLRYRYRRWFGTQLPFIDIGHEEWKPPQEFDCYPDEPLQLGDIDMGANLYLMPVASVRRDELVGTEGLILRRYEDAEEKDVWYERFGYFQRYLSKDDFVTMAERAQDGAAGVIEII